MNFFRFTFLVTYGIFLTACGGADETSPTNTEVVASQTVTSSIVVDAGKDTYLKLNNTTQIKALSIPMSSNVSSYLWEENQETLATEQEFTYMATSLGIKKLKLTVLYSDGVEVSDTLNVIVTSKTLNTSIPIISQALKTKYLLAVNNARTQTQECGTKGSFPATTTLTWNDKLYKASYEHMQDLIESKTFAHEGSGTESDWSGYKLGKKSDLITRAEHYNYSWYRLGENLGGGTTVDQVEEMVQLWLESDYHCENLMNPNFTELGMVMIKKEGSLYTHYWGQNFGTPK